MLHALAPANALTRARGLLVAGALVLGGLVPLLAASPACASSGHAALVVDTGEQVLEMCIALPEPEVTGIDLIELAHEQHGLGYSLGFGGQAVCMLAGVGPSGDDCWADHPYFWGYWHGGEGGWTWASTGAGSNTVTEGDIEGWSWGTGQSPDSHPAPPPRTFADVCEVAAPPDVGPDVEEPDDAPPSPIAEIEASPEPPEEPAPKRTPKRDGAPQEPPSPDPTLQPVAEPAATEETSPQGVVALGVSAGLFAAGALVARRRRRKEEAGGLGRTPRGG